MAGFKLFGNITLFVHLSNPNIVKWTGLVLLLILVSMSGGHGQTCTSSDPISGSNCKFQTDQGVIDLTSADSGSATPYFDDQSDPVSGSGQTYSYNPCTPFSEGDQVGCSNQLVCQTLSDGSTTEPLGDPTSPQCMSDNGLYIQYSSFYGGTQRTTNVQLQCTTDSTPTLQVSDDTVTTGTYPFTLTGQVSCPNSGPPPHSTAKPSGGGGGGLSVGSILCIVFIVLVSVYFIGGMVFMYFARGARGVEVVPNVTFWKELPGLVKDGGKFTVNKIRGQGASYDKI